MTKKFKSFMPNGLMQVKLFEITDEWIESQRLARHWRLTVFVHKGTKCVSCGRVGTHVKHWYQSQYAFEHRHESKSGHGGLHVDIVGFDKDGREFLMTVDHIKPKSKGGGKNIENLQPMCEECNSKKADTYDEEA